MTVTIVETASILLTNKNIKLIKKVLRKARDFSTRMQYANKRIREIWMKMINATYNTVKDMINKLQSLKGKTKLNLFKSISNFYDEFKTQKFSNSRRSFV